MCALCETRAIHTLLIDSSCFTVHEARRDIAEIPTAEHYPLREAGSPSVEAFICK